MSRKSTSSNFTMKNKTNPEGLSTLDLAATGPNPESQPATKRRKVDVKNDASDKLDPVEKLLSFADLHNDILHSLDQETHDEPEECDDLPPSSTPTPSNISVNFTNMLQENLRHYYSNCKRGPLEVYNANSSFAILNKPLIKEQPPLPAPARHEVPFFKNVNFNPNAKSSSAYTFDEYLAYDDDEPESTSESDSDNLSPETPTSAHPSPIPTKLKMCFHYRQFNNNLNLSSHPSQAPQEDIHQFLNKRSIISGRASEMVSTGNFMINDFFL